MPSMQEILLAFNKIFCKINLKKADFLNYSEDDSERSRIMALLPDQEGN
jgi:hypothetical protein